MGHVKGIVVGMLVAYATIAITARVPMLRSLAGL